ncbi:hypothetical protein SXCC_00490 [Gluconacetobacter sp. SXCC-1]|nr:hypothetical protein SXCC_00490 [Gluconacetobacter sp. SXCC-1]
MPRENPIGLVPAFGTALKHILASVCLQEAFLGPLASHYEGDCCPSAPFTPGRQKIMAAKAGLDCSFISITMARIMPEADASE